MVSSMQKMKFIATIDGDTHTVEVEQEGQDVDKVTMRLDGRVYHVDAKRMPSQIVSILLDGRSYDVDLEKLAKRGDSLDGRIHVRVRGRVIRFEMLDERRVKMKEAQSFRSDIAGAASVNSPMPGKVLKILAQEGDEITAGQGVVVIEAMKMENELRAPKAGKVKSLHVKEGEAVEAGAHLLTIK